MMLKEARALLPVCVAGALAVAVGWTDTWLSVVATLAYFFACAALGAFAFGHEYSSRTMALLLSQPVSRNRIFFVKLGALGVALLALGIVAAGALPGDLDPTFAPIVLWLPPIVSLGLAPWFTLLTRTPIAGAVFPVAIAGILLVAGEWIGIQRWGDGRETDAFRTAFACRGLLALSAVGFAMSWWTLARLQAIDGRGAHIAFDAFAADPGASARGLVRRHPVLKLIAKELRLQQLPLAIAALYSAVYVLVAALGTSKGIPSLLAVGTAMYAGVTAILIGSLASAEERHLGTHQWQILLPLAAWKQWAIKAGGAIALALLLGVVLPWMLASILPLRGTGASIRDQLFTVNVAALMIVAVTSGSLFVSSLSATGLWAVMMSFAGFLGVSTLLSAVTYTLMRALPDLFWRGGQVFGRHTRDEIALTLVAVLITVALWLAFRNHRTTDRSWRTTAAQVACMVAVIAALHVTATLLRL
jgi:hypothetical protein